MPLSAEEYRGGLQKAYLGEICGRASFEGLAARHDLREYAERLHTLARLETQMAQQLAPALRRYEIHPSADRMQAASEQGRAAVCAIRDWRGFLDWLTTNIDPFIERYAMLLGSAPQSDREVLRLFVVHQVALIEFGRRESLGTKAASVAPIREVLGMLADLRQVTEPVSTVIALRCTR